MKYAIKATYFYYGNTFNAPKNGFLKDGADNIEYFNSVKDALNFLNLTEEAKPCKGKNTFNKNWSQYILNYGEYAEPTYTLVYKND
jgi:hypothetical protein